MLFRSTRKLGRDVIVAVVCVADVVMAFEVNAPFPFIMISSEFEGVVTCQSVEDSSSCLGNGDMFRV